MTYAMAQLFRNWKTSSAGLVMIVGSVVHLAFHHNTEEVWVVSITAIITGIGLIFAGDASKSESAHDETKAALSQMSKTIATTAGAAASGDTGTLTRVAAAKTPELGAVPPVATPPKTG